MSAFRCAWSITVPVRTVLPATPVHLHPFEQETGRFAQVAAEN